MPSNPSPLKIFLIRKTSRKRSKCEPMRNKRIALKLPNKKTIYQTQLNPHSLVSISTHVHNYLLTNPKCTPLDVTRHIVALLSSHTTISAISYKNIQRRVYDAINVMTSLGLLTKHNNNILSCSNSSNSNTNDLTYLKQQIKSKQTQLMTLLCKVNCFNTYINKNKTSFNRHFNQHKLHLPFVLVKDNKQHPISFTNKANGSQLFATAQQQIELITFDNICKELTYDVKDNAITIAKDVVSDECAMYVASHNLVNECYKEVECERRRKEMMMYKEEDNKKYFDIDFGMFLRKDSNISLYCGNDDTTTQYKNNSMIDYTMNASTNFYSN